MDNSVNLLKVGGHKVIHVRVMKLYSMYIGLGKWRQVGKQNIVVARKVTEACGLSLRTVHCIFQVSVRMQDNQATLWNPGQM